MTAERRGSRALCSHGLALLIDLCAMLVVHAKEAAPASADPALEARVMRVAAELRCLVCQNETIAASHADLAVDLRNQVREMLRTGKTEREVFDYMTARYGDFVLYKPPVKSTTWLLWFGPFLLLAAGAIVWWSVSRRRGRRIANDAPADRKEKRERGDEAGDPDIG